MQVHRMIANAGYPPEVVASLTQAFEAAWEDIAGRAAGPDAERLRFKLAGIIMLTGRHVTDPIELGRVALRILAYSEEWDG